MWENEARSWICVTYFTPSSVYGISSSCGWAIHTTEIAFRTTGFFSAFGCLSLPLLIFLSLVLPLSHTCMFAHTHTHTLSDTPPFLFCWLSSFKLGFLKPCELVSPGGGGEMAGGVDFISISFWRQKCHHAGDMIDHVRKVLCPGPLSHRSRVIPSPEVIMQVNILYSHFENVHYCEMLYNTTQHHILFNCLKHCKDQVSRYLPLSAR